jgi:hypothetical protein
VTAGHGDAARQVPFEVRQFAPADDRKGTAHQFRGFDYFAA